MLLRVKYAILCRLFSTVTTHVACTYAYIHVFIKQNVKFVIYKTNTRQNIWPDFAYLNG